MKTTTEQASELLDELEDVREAWRAWTERWDAYRRSLRAAGYDTSRLHAYGVGRGFDEGGGQSIEDWFAEIETGLLMRTHEPADA